MLLIHPLLHFSQTTRAFQSSEPDTLSEITRPAASLLTNLFSPGKKASIQSLQRCSKVSLAVDGLNAHSLGMRQSSHAAKAHCCVKAEERISEEEA